MSRKFGDYCHAYHWSGTAGVVLSGNPTTRFVGFEGLVLNTHAGSAGASVVTVRDSSAGGAIQYLATVSAVPVVSNLPVPVEVGRSVYLDVASSGTISALDVILYMIKDDHGR